MGHDVSHALQVLKARAGTKEQVCHLGIEFLTPFVACYFSSRRAAASLGGCSCHRSLVTEPSERMVPASPTTAKTDNKKKDNMSKSGVLVQKRMIV